VSGSGAEPATQAVQAGWLAPRENSVSGEQGAQVRSAEAEPGASTRQPPGQSVQSEQPRSPVGVQGPVRKEPAAQPVLQGRQLSEAPSVSVLLVKPAAQAQAFVSELQAALAEGQLVQPA